MKETKYLNDKQKKTLYVPEEYLVEVRSSSDYSIEDSVENENVIDLDKEGDEQEVRITEEMIDHDQEFNQDEDDCCHSKHRCTWFIFVLVIGLVAVPELTYLLRHHSESETVDSEVVDEPQFLTESSIFSVPNLHTTFLFEINRHGARTAYWDDPRATEGSPVPAGMLTPMGMRQRSLLGRWNSIKHKDFLSGRRSSLLEDSLFDGASQIYVHSTDVLRTI